MGVSLKDLELMKARIGGQKPDPTGLLSLPGVTTGRVLGIDPSLRGTGYGLIEVSGGSPRAVEYGTIKCPRDWPRSRCLARIVEVLRDLVARQRPTTAALEALFHAHNVRTALIMGEARGAAMGVLATAGLELYEMAPTRVKQAVTGYGAATKHAVASMVQRFLNLPELPDPDAADALALALAHARERGRSGIGGMDRL